MYFILPPIGYDYQNNLSILIFMHFVPPQVCTRESEVVGGAGTGRRGSQDPEGRRQVQQGDAAAGRPDQGPDEADPGGRGDGGRGGRLGREDTEGETVRGLQGADRPPRDTRDEKEVLTFFAHLSPSLPKGCIFFRTLNVFYSWLVVAMVYYGLSFNSKNLGADRYVSTFVSGFVEVFFFFNTVF